MIRLKKLLKEQNKKSNYEMVMDIIGEFLELKDNFESRVNSIEEILQKLKPNLDDRQKLNPMDFDSEENDYLKKDEDY
tara:strand:+ start:16 stop:249 length:234 start_codon:yes stop_codon:yes gene_type:complete